MQLLRSLRSNSGNLGFLPMAPVYKFVLYREGCEPNEELKVCCDREKNITFQVPYERKGSLHCVRFLFYTVQPEAGIPCF